MKLMLSLALMLLAWVPWGSRLFNLFWIPNGPCIIVVPAVSCYRHKNLWTRKKLFPVTV